MAKPKGKVRKGNKGRGQRTKTVTERSIRTGSEKREINPKKKTKRKGQHSKNKKKP